jgi:hypothetical protein
VWLTDRVARTLKVRAHEHRLGRGRPYRATPAHCTRTLQQREALRYMGFPYYSSAQYPEALRCAGAPRAARARAHHRRRPERCIVFVIDGTRRHGVLPDRVGVTGSWKLRCSVPSSTACRAVQPSSVPEARRRLLVGRRTRVGARVRGLYL